MQEEAKDVHLFITQDGSHSVLSERFGVSYHSKYGAIQESRHVFIGAGLYPQLLVQNSLNILELGFGSGLNAFLTYLESRNRTTPIQYTGIEHYPMPLEKIRKLNYPTQLKAAEEEGTFLRFHEDSWEEAHAYGDNFTLLKSGSDFHEYPYPGEYFHLVFFDAFAPSAHPEAWEVPLLEKMYETLLPGGALVTYCAKGVVKRTLKGIGFELETLPGPPGKREMIRAVK